MLYQARRRVFEPAGYPAGSKTRLRAWGIRMSRVAELLLEWEERHEAGDPVSVEALCAQKPWLREALAHRIEQLKRFQRIENPSPTPEAPPASVGGHAIKRVLGAGGTGIV